MSSGLEIQTERVELGLEGMTCASCAARIERKLNRLEGVQASINFATERATVTFDPQLADVGALIRTVEHTGYGAELAQPSSARRADDLGARLLVSLVLTVPVALLAMVSPLQFSGWRWVGFGLATP